MGESLTTPPPKNSASSARPGEFDRLSSKPIAILRLLAYILFTLVLMPVQVIFNLTSKRLAKRLPKAYHRICLWLLGIKVIRRGRPEVGQPTLFISNHVSYMDISVLGSLLEVSFVAKEEMITWPFFGWCAKLQRSIFIERNPRRASEHVELITKRLEGGDDILIFPEGTTGDGTWVAPFKSSLFSVAQKPVNDKPLMVQPISMSYARLDGMPMGRAIRPYYAWMGDEDLFPHMFYAAGLGIMTVIVEFHPPITIEQFANRKQLSQYCYEQVSDGLAQGISGRPQTHDHSTLLKQSAKVPDLS